MDVKFLKSMDLCLKLFDLAGFKRVIFAVFHIIFIISFICGLLLKLSTEEEFWKAIEIATIIVGMLELLIIIIKIYKDFAKLEEITEIFKEIVRFTYNEDLEDRKYIKNGIDMTNKMNSLNLVVLVVITIFFTMLLYGLKKLPFDMIYPFDIENNFGFMLAASHQLYAVLFGGTILLCYFFLSMIFMGLSSGLLEEIEKRLDFLVRYSDENEMRIEYFKCVEIHNMIRKIVFEIQQTFQLIYSFKPVSNIINLSFLAFVSVDTDDVMGKFKSVSIFIFVTLQLFLPCFFGQNLINSSNSTMKFFIHYSHKFRMSEAEEENVKIFINLNITKPIAISFLYVCPLKMTTFYAAMMASLFLFLQLEYGNFVF